MGKLKSAKELANLEKELTAQLDNFNGSKTERKRIESKLKGIRSQLECLVDEDNTK